MQQPTHLQQVPQPPEDVTTNVLGEVVPVSQYAQPAEVPPHVQEPTGPKQRRLLGSVLLIVAGTMLTVSFAVYAAGLVAEAGGFVLLAAFIAIWYLTLAPERQHPKIMRRYTRLSAQLDRRVEPMRRRADVEMSLRKERDTFDRIKRERTRRVMELGELAYRRYRAGEVVESLEAHAQRVQSIEQRLLVQDHRVHEIEAQRTEPKAPKKGRKRGKTDPPGEV
jgi:hypothetical protein